MGKYTVTVKHGDPGKFKNNSQNIMVEAESDSSAKSLAINKLKNSNAAYRNKEFEVTNVKKH